MDFANAAWPELGTTKDNKHFQLPTDVQILLEPERDRVQRSAQERRAARQEVGQAQVREDRVHRQGRSGEKAGLCTIKLEQNGGFFLLKLCVFSLFRRKLHS